LTDVDGTKTYNIAVVGRALDLLESLADATEPQGVSDLARSIGATKSATFRILATLGDRGYVLREPESGKYYLGLRLVGLGQKSLESIDLRAVARPVLEDLHHRFNETVNMGVQEDYRIIYVDIIESHYGLRMSARVGAQDLMHSTAIGKAILAYSGDDFITAYLNRPLERRTKRTLIHPEALLEELERIRRSGFSRDRQENEEGATCFGAPIFDHRGEVVAAISVSGPSTRLTGEKAEDVAVAVRHAAGIVTTRLGYRSPSPVLERSS
jgi:IclR family transcriptional regulator, KDG regulon repressor